jgi:NitT/TauT family transport system substrate-binding protein
LSRRLWTIAIILLCVLAAAVLWKKWPRPASIKKITIAQSGDFFLYAPLYVASDAGFFRKQGLDVNIVSTGGDEKTWAAVISGSAQFGVGDPTFVAISQRRGQPGKVIASIVNGVPFWGITLDQNMTPIKVPGDLKGHVVGTFPSPSTAYALQKKMFLDGGLKPEIREGAFGTIFAMLRAGEVDIGLELEPNVSQALTENAKIVYSMKDIYGSFAITGLSASPAELQKEPELAQAVTCSLQLSLDYIRLHPEDALAILTKRFTEIKPDVARAALARVVAERIIPVDLDITDAAWQNAISLRKFLGDIDNPLPMSSYVDESFSNSAIQNCRLK